MSKGRYRAVGCRGAHPAAHVRPPILDESGMPCKLLRKRHRPAMVASALAEIRRLCARAPGAWRSCRAGHTNATTPRSPRSRPRHRRHTSATGSRPSDRGFLVIWTSGRGHALGEFIADYDDLRLRPSRPCRAQGLESSTPGLHAVARGLSTRDDGEMPAGGRAS